MIVKHISAGAVALALAACQPTTTGMNTGVVERAAASSFDNEVVPAISTACTADEITRLRRATIDAARALNTGDIGAATAIGDQLQSISPGCQQAFRQRTAEICAQSAVRDAPPGTPTDLIRARAQDCYR